MDFGLNPGSMIFLMVKNANTSPEQVTVSLVETAKTSKAKGGVLFSEMPGR